MDNKLKNTSNQSQTITKVINYEYKNHISYMLTAFIIISIIILLDERLEDLWDYFNYILVPVNSNALKYINYNFTNSIRY